MGSGTWAWINYFPGEIQKELAAVPYLCELFKDNRFSKPPETGQGSSNFPNVKKLGSVKYQLVNLSLKPWQGSRSGTKA